MSVCTYMSVVHFKTYKVYETVLQPYKRNKLLGQFIRILMTVGKYKFLTTNSGLQILLITNPGFIMPRHHKQYENILNA